MEVNKNKVCINVVLKELMEEKGINSIELSEKTSVPASTIRGWLNGKANPVTSGDLLAVAHFFKTSIEYLCFGAEKNNELEG